MDTIIGLILLVVLMSALGFGLIKTTAKNPNTNFKENNDAMNYDDDDFDD